MRSTSILISVLMIAVTIYLIAQNWGINNSKVSLAIAALVIFLILLFVKIRKRNI
ncbi:MAG: hypothetical protein ABIP35_15260 [Ginsengibacter sp.]